MLALFYFNSLNNCDVESGNLPVISYVLLPINYQVFLFWRGQNLKRNKSYNNPVWQPFLQENFGNYISKTIYVF